MRVTVRLFAMLRERAGTSEWACDLPPGASAADAWRALVRAHAGLESFSGAVSPAVNEEFARMDTRLRDGDDVAFLPPVSGGQGERTQDDAAGS
ncbi:MAG: molybdopterin converting factor subunit 1 [Acidobacteria bacterium]|nr:molybdopterin converting factor subunit 1 [Acidobacteriota bacterium]